jgi:predicted AAA+ superfamily ATPase
MIHVEALLDRLIAELHERRWPVPTRRDARVPWLTGKADTVVGMRRAGKTWFLYQVMNELVARGTPREAILYLNFEDERLLPLETKDLQVIPEVYFRRYPQMRQRSCAFFFDEIHRVPGWEGLVRRLMDTEDVHICLSGSSARLLSRELGSSLRGRSITTEIFPFSFDESLRHAGIEVPRHRPGPKIRSLLEHRFLRYLETGGFPEVQGIDEPLRVRIIQEYLDLVVLRDVVERHGVTAIAPLRYLLRHIVNNSGAAFSVHRFYRGLRSLGIPSSKGALYEHLGHLADAFFCFPVPLETDSERVRMANPRKVYLVDTGIATAAGRRPRPEWGHLLENAVFLAARRRAGTSITYYRTRSGREVDFLVRGPGRGELRLVQVCADTSDARTRERELQSLGEAMVECGLRHGVLVTMTEEGQVDIEAGRVDVVPAWWWVTAAASPP